MSAVVVESWSTYAAEVKCSEDATRQYMHPWCINKNNGMLASVPPILDKDEKATIPTMFKKAVSKFADVKCMGTRPVLKCTVEGKKQFWKKGEVAWRSYKEVGSDVNALAQAVIKLPGLREARMDQECVAAILADTSAEWQISAQAMFLLGVPITTVYTTLGHEAMLHGLNETQAMVLFLDWGQYSVLKEPVLSKCPNIKHIVLIGSAFVPQETNGKSSPFPSREECAGLGSALGKSIVTISNLIADGAAPGSTDAEEGLAQIDLQKFAPNTNDLAFIMYTSGSTGLPKGVMLTHANFVALIASVLAQGTISPSAPDVFIAFLPLAHILELMVETVVLVQGAAIAYAHARTVTPASPYIAKGDDESADLLAIRPTLMVAVPAILEAIKTGLLQKLKAMDGFIGSLVRAAVNKAQNLPSEEGGLADCLASMVGSMCLGQVKSKMGLENLRCIASGGAPLAAQTQDFIGAVLAPIAQGYGATETTGCTSVQECLSSDGRPADKSSGYVGAIQPACEIRLVSVPDMGYLVTDNPPRGEILISGNTVASGYYKMPEKTAEDFRADSSGKKWFHTGDVGLMSPEGTLKIIDRKKDLVKLSGGEYVSLGKVEATLKQVSGIGAVVVFAQSDKDHCVAIISQPERGWSAVGGKPEEETLLKDIEKTLRELGLARFEIPTKVKIDDGIWTPDNGLMTASMKLQRNPLREFYNQPGGMLDQMGYRFSTK